MTRKLTPHVQALVAGAMQPKTETKLDRPSGRLAFHVQAAMAGAMQARPAATESGGPKGGLAPHVLAALAGAMQAKPAVAFRLEPETAANGASHGVSSARPGTVLQRMKKKAPKYLSYGSMGTKDEEEFKQKANEKQKNLGRQRRLHKRHIIPHSDLQMWILEARATNSLGKGMRNIISGLLGAFGEGTLKKLWDKMDTDYLNLKSSEKKLVFYNVWKSIEWHNRNLFLGTANINEALQNRFDAGAGAYERFGKSHVQALHKLWFAASTALELNPTGIEKKKFYSTFLKGWIEFPVAEHKKSRSVKAIVGTIHRSDY